MPTEHHTHTHTSRDINMARARHHAPCGSGKPSLCVRGLLLSTHARVCMCAEHRCMPRCGRGGTSNRSGLPKCDVTIHRLERGFELPWIYTPMYKELRSKTGSLEEEEDGEEDTVTIPSSEFTKRVSDQEIRMRKRDGSVRTSPAVLCRACSAPVRLLCALQVEYKVDGEKKLGWMGRTRPQARKGLDYRRPMRDARDKGTRRIFLGATL